MSEPAEILQPVRLGAASVLLASGTIVSRVLGFLKVAVLAAAIGQLGSASADAFAVANQLPNNIYALIAGGVLSAVLVPQVVKASRGADGGSAYINKIVTVGVVGFAAVTLIATLLAPALVDLYSQSTSGGPGFTPAAHALATSFAYLCLPQIFFYAMYSLLSEVLNARNVFGPFTWAPVLNNVVAIVGLVVFMVLFGQAQQNSAVSAWSGSGILLLAGTATLGVAAQAIVLLFFWKRAGLRFRFDFQWKGVGLSTTGKAAGWLFGMILVTQLAGIVQSRVASLASGNAASISTLQASWLIFMLPHSIVAVSIALALIDLDTKTLPNRIVVPSMVVMAVLLAVASVGTGDWFALLWAIVAGAALFVFYLLLVIIYPSGMGFGDVKLAAVVGLALGYLGWGTVIVGAFAAFLLGGVFSIVLLAIGKATRKTGIPFGPWMLLGAWVGIAFGREISTGYLTLVGIS